MKTLLKILNAFFVFLGVIFFILIILAVIFIITDPFNLKPLLKQVDIASGIKSITDDSPPADKHPLLDAEQEKTLQTFGIDPATLPTTITPEMEGCAVEKLGQARVDQIKAGAEPSFTDYLKAGSCISN